jgi:hypothetical protein
MVRANSRLFVIFDSIFLFLLGLIFRFFITQRAAIMTKGCIFAALLPF